MKRTILVLTIVVGSAAAAFAQSNSPSTQTEPVHPGTAILDSMGIYAGQSLSSAPAGSVAMGNDAKVAGQLAAGPASVAPSTQR